jgi:dTDP-4-amino-4,6-dideoxygalactose transaminase
MIPYCDLRAQYKSIKPEIDEAVLRVLDSAEFVLGSEVEAFEREFATYVGAEHAIAANSGTSALHLALLAAGVGPGAEVITVPFTFVATTAAIVYTGATPVFVDVQPDTLTMDPAQVEAAITPRTRAILPVHIYGQSVDLDPLLAIARRHGLRLIEDACQAHGAEYHGRRVGAIGDSGCFSFYPGKNLGAYGEGGIAVTNDAAQARAMRMLRDWGQEQRYHHVLKGFNYRMEGLQGAILRVKLRHLERWTELRRTHAASYREVLRGSGLSLPVEQPYARHVYHVFAIRVAEREALQRQLKANGIQSGIHYPIPVHLQTAYADLGYVRGQFPEAERAADEVLSLPMYPEMTRTQVEEVCGVLQEAYVI